jgi:TonB family protein
MTITSEIKYHYQSAAVTLLTAIILFLLLYFIPYAFNKPAPQLEEMGMLVNLGNSTDGSGEEQPMSDAQQSEQSNAISKTAAAQQLPDAINTQSHEDAPSVETPKNHKTKSNPITKKPIENPDEQKQKTEAERIAKEKAIQQAKEEAFKNKLKGALNQANQSKSEGDGKGIGDKGVPDGDPNGKVYSGENTGLGNAGSGPSFRGKIRKRARRKIPNIIDNSKEEGKIAVNIIVDASGNVTSVNFTEKGSTSSSSYLRGLALKAAKDIKFSPKQDADEESGTVIFSFKNR